MSVACPALGGCCGELGTVPSALSPSAVAHVQGALQLDRLARAVLVQLGGRKQEAGHLGALAAAGRLFPRAHAAHLNGDVAVVFVGGKELVKGVVLVKVLLVIDRCGLRADVGWARLCVDVLRLVRVRVVVKLPAQKVGDVNPVLCALAADVDVILKLIAPYWYLFSPFKYLASLYRLGRM